MKINWKYAIGEVLIVIIGISLAFSLNNWKESRTDKIQKAQYLTNLVIDIEQEITQLDENQKKITLKLENITAVQPFLGRDEGRRDSIVPKVFDIARIISFNPENTTYQTLINSGDMSLIDNFNLRRTIEEHYSQHNAVMKNYERIEQIHQKYLGDFFIYHIDYEEVAMGRYEFLDNPLLKNIFNSILGAYYMVLEGNKNCLKSNKRLLKRIKREL